MAELTYNILEELPIYNWFKCNETNDYKWLLRVYDKEYKEDLQPLYDTLHQEYLDLFGAGTEREKLMSLLRKLIKHKADLLLGKRHVINYIKVIEHQLSIQKICAIMSKYQGYKIDPKETNVVEFHEIINLMDKENGNETD